LLDIQAIALMFQQNPSRTKDNNDEDSNTRRGHDR
jgi:hypothetical protein